MSDRLLPLPSAERDEQVAELQRTVREREDFRKVAVIRDRCICGRLIARNPFGGKSRCNNCGAWVGPK